MIQSLKTNLREKESELIDTQNKLKNSEADFEEISRKYKITDEQKGILEKENARLLGVERKLVTSEANLQALSRKYEALGRRKNALEEEKSRLLDVERRLVISEANFQAIANKYRSVDNAEFEAKRIIQQANSIQAKADFIMSQANRESATIRTAAKTEAKDIVMTSKEKAEAIIIKAQNKLQSAEIKEEESGKKADIKLSEAGEQAVKIIEAAKLQANAIAGDSYRALQQADQIESSIKAMKNIIEGYGDRYILPSYSVIDDLTKIYSHTEIGQELKKARERSQLMMLQGRAASCNYIEKNRRDTAIRFVLDAFNGKVDSTLSRAKTENHGTLMQEIKDAAAIVNHNGWAFRNAQINPEYISARIEELQWLIRTNQLREREKEEQRRIREQIREEERERKEYERALKDSAREEELVRKALEKAQAHLAKANEEQRQRYEEQIQQLNLKLSEAEEKSKRALSMAQQTKIGHVYIISNIGSFGENVYKIGMTRRLEPLDRIRELSSASVPFGFDVHAMIFSENAPDLEKSLHRKFIQTQMNKVNPRKEFFKLTITDIKKEIELMGIEASWTLAAEAREFKETQAIEGKMQNDEMMRNEWLRQQLIYEEETPEEVEHD